jgi:predicted nucleic acid-binding protein
MSASSSFSGGPRRDAGVEPEAERVLSETDGEELHAPHLLRFELTNIAWKKIRQRPDAAAVIVEHLRDALALPVTLVDVDHEAVLHLAVKHKMTAYDASYLWLARQLEAPLVTLDRGLRRLATR